MNLDEQLRELLGSLGVALEADEAGALGGRAALSEDGAEPSAERASEPGSRAEGQAAEPAGAQASFSFGVRAREELDAQDDETLDAIGAPADISLFQTSREHYGVFYRLDLVAGLPQLRIYTPEEDGALKMRCYLVRAAAQTPLHAWFLATRAHHGSQAYDDMRETTQQHLLFAAGELMKRLFWTGEPERMRFPREIEVLRLA